MIQYTMPDLCLRGLNFDGLLHAFKNIRISIVVARRSYDLSFDRCVKDIDTGRAILDTKYSLKRATAGTFPKFFSEGGSKDSNSTSYFRFP